MSAQQLSPTETIQEWNRRYPRTGPGQGVISIFNHFPPVAVPCPAWCTDPEGHSYDQEDHDGAEIRTHAREFGDEQVMVGVGQSFVYRDGGEKPLEAPEVLIWIGGNCHEGRITDPDQARRLAAALVDAADHLEALRSTTTEPADSGGQVSRDE